MKVEVCASSYQSVLNATKAGADNIELCSELAVGGLTPSYGMLHMISQQSTSPINVLIRPRSGNFTYSEAEFEIMKQNVLLCKEFGFNGIVSGVLTLKHQIDIKRTKELIDLARPLSFTFHRAFDWVKDPFASVGQLIGLKIDRILSSGQKNTAFEGIELLSELQRLAANKLVIMPGGGINMSNILHFKKAGFKEIHFSASKFRKVLNQVKVPMNSSKFFDETQWAESDTELIKEMLQIVK